MSSTVVAGAIQLDAFRWMLPREDGMRVPGILFADRPLLERMMSDRTPEQVRNAAHLPGILEASIAMPDAHWGYGLPVGGVVATDPEDGVISPGAVGYDIGCGVRLLRSRLERPAIVARAEALADALYREVPCGVGSSGAVRLGSGELARVLREGARWAVKRGLGWASDLECCEEGGALADADPEAVSEGGRERGRGGLGLVYDVAHNIAKFETHELSGRAARCLVHRKGATRAFPPGHPDVPAAYRKVGQPVLVPGDMGRFSYLLIGSHGSMRHAFGSTCHGAGRQMSRTQAVRETRGRDLVAELKEAGVTVRYEGRDTLREETSEAYKDVDDVVRVVEGADLARRVARLRPFVVVKG